MSEPLPRRRACIVLGMHRSGTSALAQLLASLGADLPARLNPPKPDNPDGYFESATLAAIHDEWLAAAGSAWFDLKPPAIAGMQRDTAAALTGAMARAVGEEYRDAALPLVKDPRMCRFFPLSRQVLDVSGLDCSVVLALRHPAEVAASLAVRDQISATYSGLLWAQHVVAAERDSRDLPRISVRYEDMMADWRATADRVRQLPGSWRPDPPEPPLKPELRHHRDLSAAEMFGETLGPLLDALHGALAALAVEDGDGQRARIDAAAADVSSAAAGMAPSLEAEFLHLRLTAAQPAWRSPDPLGDRRALAALFDRIHRNPAESRP